MNRLEHRLDKLEETGGVGLRPVIRIIVDEGDDVDAAAEEAGYDPDVHFLIVRKIIG